MEILIVRLSVCLCFFSRAFEIFVSILIAAALSAASSAGPCEITESIFWDVTNGINTCVMQSTVINSNDFQITSDRDETVQGFDADGNKKMEYLPANLGAKFPSLIELDAYNCSIKEITKETFKGLNKLRWLYLSHNQIETIADDTFENIPGVEYISLGWNKIKKLNGRAFASIKQLTWVRLYDNDCIDEWFNRTSIIAEMPRVVDSKCGFEPRVCGVSKNSGLIFGGANFTRGDFPWMVALHKKELGRGPQYFCGGSLISDRHVLTAAHCLDFKKPQVIVAVFGAFDLDYRFEDGRFSRSPSKIFKHYYWNPQTNRFYADIAMLLMPEKICLSIFVQPICLWNSDEELKSTSGVVAGWGRSNGVNPVGSIPTKVVLPIRKSDECDAVQHAFCAGIADGRGPCAGDSGSGFVVHSRANFYLRGIVSNALHYVNCEHNLYAIYTDVLKFKAWIDVTMTKA